ncbi:HK97-gp10 family putative phage morphogenesis protein [Macrococcus armenti]|uniref:HK97-gp10 family putative phage morphogenesis protein n=1 Tax=Macrococcus armenti TaxID=2875764 RepID=UPI001CCC83FA|nr:HK97-gp10 family putative phage morphogenesis protein [Macrococcus armenti]UBH16402.1 hypothetical protein LAU44_05450 [Macrococcus armenti]UBH18758.1 hypothetical protein LAU39_05460 [Macrococcus armenti]UBH21030.1 hypothetical protein LAU40_05455 [Macrococcus armenti]
MVRFKGAKKMRSDLRKQRSSIDRKTDEGIREFGTMLVEDMVESTTFTKGYETGNLRRNLQYNHQNRMRGILKSPVHYSGYLEHGTRFMEAQPFFRPIIDKHHGDLIEILLGRK